MFVLVLLMETEVALLKGADAGEGDDKRVGIVRDLCFEDACSQVSEVVSAVASRCTVNPVECVKEKARMKREKSDSPS